TEQETAIDFKSLRAKFQEEIQSKERPSVPHKPKCLPPQAGRTTTPFIISSSGEDHNPAASSAVSRNDCKVAQANRPSCFFHHGNNGGSGVARLPFRDRQLPLVLPASSTHEPKRDPDVSSSKLVTSPIKCKKKAMPTPFKPPKFSKCIKDIIEGSGEHAENGKVHRPPSAEPTLIGSNGFDHQNGGSDCGSPCPSPEQSVTPPPTGENSSAVGGVTHVLSTLEKARKKFSPKSLLMYAKPKSFYASKCSPERSVAYENVHHEAEAETDSHINGDVKPAMLDVQAPLARRPLPDLPSLGPSPMKPPRPPQVDLSSYSQTVKHEPRAELSEVPDPAAADVMGPENQAVPPPPEFDAPEFPDFEASVLEALSSSLINLAALELEATEFGAPQADSLPSPPTKPEEANDMDVEGPQRHEEVIQKHLVYPAEAVGVLLERSAGPEHWKDSQASTTSSVLLSVMPFRKERSSPDHSDEKELRKREKQRLEREKKEQKEREKKENEMKKKFKITGQEEPMYHARVLVASKLRKHDLQVKSGDTVSIIRTTNCPKGKWLARDAQHNYGYISVMNVELNMKEMLELGKKAQASARGAGEADTLSLSSRSKHHPSFCSLNRLCLSASHLPPSGIYTVHRKWRSQTFEGWCTKKTNLCMLCSLIVFIY
uniref:Uncharacterized protein n=1 Tax=Pygocentrus nattereri TaxID=42514 RepID=A0A3B4DR02_PYGNA